MHLAYRLVSGVWCMKDVCGGGRLVGDGDGQK